MYGKMNRTEWLKYGNKRPEALKDAIKKGNPVSDHTGKDVYFKNTKENMSAIDGFKDEKAAYFELQTNDGKMFRSNQIGKSAIFGGQGKGGGATGKTAIGESLQCLYIAALLGEGKNKEFSHFTAETLKKYVGHIQVDKSFEDMMKADEQWHYSGYVTAKYLIQKGFATKEHVCHRGSRVMNQIYAMKKKAFKNEGMPAPRDDKWNPGDIWLVKKGISPLSELDDTNVTMLNASIKKAYDERKIIGISLKIVNSLTKKAKHKEYNMEKVDLDRHRFKGIKLQADSARKTFWSSKGGYIMYDGTGKMDVRTPSALGSPGIELIGTGARGGRAGFDTLSFAAQKFLKTTLPSNKDIIASSRLMVGGKNERLAKMFWKKANAIDSSIKWDGFWDELKTQSVDRIHANLAAVEITHAIHKAPAKARDDFMSFVVNNAASKAGTSSAFIKVEEA